MTLSIVTVALLICIVVVIALAVTKRLDSLIAGLFLVILVILLAGSGLAIR